MKSVILITVSVMACLLPILSVEGELQAAWKVSREGRTGKLHLIFDNGFALSLPISLLPQLQTGNNSAGKLFVISSDGEMNFSNETIPQTTTETTTETIPGTTTATTTESIPETTTEIIPTTTETISETTTDTTTETIPDTTTETIPQTTTETTTETIPETTTDTTTETIPETTTETIPQTTTETTTETIPETTTDTTTETIPETTTETIPQTTTETIPETTTDTTTENIPETTTEIIPTTTETKTEITPDDGLEPPDMLPPDSEGIQYFRSFSSISLTGCRPYCAKYTGFRLAIAKTKESMERLRTYGNVAVDMSISRNPRTGKVRFIWGDGTELDPSLTRPDLGEPVMNSGSESSVLVMYTNGPNVLLDDELSTLNIRCLCQGTRRIFEPPSQ